MNSLNSHLISTETETLKFSLLSLCFPWHVYVCRCVCYWIMSSLTVFNYLVITLYLNEFLTNSVDTHFSQMGVEAILFWIHAIQFWFALDWQLYQFYLHLQLFKCSSFAFCSSGWRKKNKPLNELTAARDCLMSKNKKSWEPI